jgi:hypothetical protein
VGINRRFFFDFARRVLFKGRMRQRQVDGLSFILDTWEAHYARKDDRWLAYALGTTHHETGATMQPIKEYGGRRYFFHMYDIEGDRPRVARQLGNTQPGDGVLFHGRGYVQLTGRSNYTKMQRKFDIDLTSSDKAANRALEPELAAKIMFYGMEKGVFTGKKFADYFDEDTDRWVSARSIINPRDKPRLVADYALDYYAAISRTT